MCVYGRGQYVSARPIRLSEATTRGTRRSRLLGVRRSASHVEPRRTNNVIAARAQRIQYEAWFDWIFGPPAEPTLF